MGHPVEAKQTPRRCTGAKNSPTDRDRHYDMQCIKLRMEGVCNSRGTSVMPIEWNVERRQQDLPWNV